MYLEMQDDANLVVYQADTPVWASHTERARRTFACDQAPRSEATQVWTDFDRPGGDLPGMPITSLGNYASCATECVKCATSCKAWTFVRNPVPSGPPQCWLKGSQPQRFFRPGMISGNKVWAP
jgi:PAN domain